MDREREHKFHQGNGSIGENWQKVGVKGSESSWLQISQEDKKSNDPLIVNTFLWVIIKGSAKEIQ